MDTPGTEVPNFKGVVGPEGMLNAEGPVYGFRHVLEVREKRTGSRPLRGDTGESTQPAGARQDASARKKSAACAGIVAQGLHAVVGGTKLGRKSQKSKVVKQRIESFAEARADGGSSARARGPCDTYTRRKVGQRGASTI